MTPLVVGQAPGPGRNADPLRGRCGRRLADLCGLEEEAFYGLFRRANLIRRWPGRAGGKGDAFPIDLARRGALQLVVDGWLADGPVVLLGGNVARAFGLGDLRPLRWWEPPWLAPRGIALCPHPSGVSLWWNDPANEEAARRFWRRLARRANKGG